MKITINDEVQIISKPKPIITYIPIFMCSVIVCTDCSAKDAADAFYDFKKLRTVVEPHEFDGWVQSINGDIYMWCRDSSNLNIVYHELVHVAFEVCQLKCMEADEELIAYLMGWLHDNVAKKLLTKTK